VAGGLAVSIFISSIIVCRDSRLDDFFIPSVGPTSPLFSAAACSLSCRAFLLRWYVSVDLASKVAWRFSLIDLLPGWSLANPGMSSSSRDG